MTYQCANGKTIRISEEQFFKMTDLDFKDLEGSNYGSMINNPFFDSILNGPVYEGLQEDLDEELTLEDIPLDFEPDVE